MNQNSPFAELKIDYHDPRSLKRNPFNPNVVDPINYEKLKNSLLQDGFYDAVKVRTLEDGSLEILGGQHRTQVAIDIGIDRVPVINLGVIDDRRAKLICLKDNANYGAEDPLKLRELFSSDIGSAQDILSVLPIDDAQLASFFEHDTALDDFETEFDAADSIDDTTIDLSPTKTTQTHIFLRYKVPIDDADSIREMIERVQREQGFTDGDSLTNAGDALVWLLTQGITNAEA